MNNHNMLYLGYVAINTELRQKNIYTGRTLILKTVKEKGLEYIKTLARLNIADLKKILEWNEEHGIRCYRITSNLFPHLDNPKLDDLITKYNVKFLAKELKEIGDYAKKYKHRLTMHPGQFVQLGSKSETTVKNSIRTLREHTRILKAMNLTPKDGSGLIIHGGGVFGDKQATMERWKDNFLSMHKDIRDFIILENDEWSYSITDLLPLCEELNIPFCLDIFHNSISKDKIELTDKLLQRIFKTWKNFPPKIHYSTQEPGMKKGSHSKSVSELPDWVLRLPHTFNTDIYLMLEVKDKEQSVINMLHKYFTKVSDNNKVYWLVKYE